MFFEVIHTADADIEIMRTSERPPDIVVLPELFGGIRGYAPFCQLVAETGIEVLAINPRSCGNSTGDLQGLTMDVLVQDIQAVLRMTSTPCTYFVGHAFGNRIARLLAVRSPHSVKGLVLLAAGGQVRGSLMAHLWLLRAAQSRLNQTARINAWNRFMLAPGMVMPSQLREWNDRSDRLARASIRAQRAMPTETWWAGGAAPMLVIQGTRDRVAPIKNGHQMAKKWPKRVEVIDLPDVGHGLPFQAPLRIAEEIASWKKRTELSKHTQQDGC